MPSRRNRLSACRPARVIVQAASEYKTREAPPRAPALETNISSRPSFQHNHHHCLSLPETYRPSRQLLFYHLTQSANMPPKKSTTTAAKKAAPAPQHASYLGTSLARRSLAILPASVFFPMWQSANELQR